VYYRFFSIDSEYRNAAYETSPQKHKTSVRIIVQISVFKTATKFLLYLLIQLFLNMYNM